MKNKYRIDNGIAYVEVFDKDILKEVMVDVEAIDFLVAFKGTWRLKKDGYPYGNFRRPDGSYQCKAMHRYLMNPPDDMVVDHINRNGLDNRKANLRVVTKGQNTQNISIHGNKRNTSGHRNICKRGNRWSVAVKDVYLGRFDTLEEAIKVRDKALIELQPYCYEAYNTQ